MTPIADRNRKTFERIKIVKDFIADYITPAEREIAKQFAEDYSDKSVLDLGVGAGRTARWLAPVARRYIGIDYSRRMIAACREQYSQYCFQVGDAHDLSRFSADQFDFVLFSFNGIDFVDHQDRQRIYREVWRVLKSGGLFVFSSHLLDGPRPKSVFYDFQRREYLSIKHLAHVAIRLANLSRRSHLQMRADGYAILLDPSYDYALPTYYISVAEQFRQLDAVNFQHQPTVYPEFPAPPYPHTPYSYYYVARKKPIIVDK